MALYLPTLEEQRAAQKQLPTAGVFPPQTTTAPAPVPMISPVAPTVDPTKPQPTLPTEVTPTGTGVALAPPIMPTTTEMLGPGPATLPPAGPAGDMGNAPATGVLGVAPAPLPTPTTTEFVNGPGNTGPVGSTGPAPLPGMQSFGPGDNLIGTQINPTVDPRLQQTQGQVDALQQGVLDRYNQMGTPDRQAMALESLRLLDEQTADTRKLGTQQIGRDAARLGRLGSGMVTTSLGDLEERLNISRDQAMRQLANETAGYQLDDQLRGLGAGQGILEQYSGLEGQQYGQGAADRGELRGERGYQQYLDQQALNNWLQQQNFSNQLAGSWLDQDLAYNSMFGTPGYASPSPIYGQVSGQYGQQAAGSMGASADLLNALLAGGYLGGK